MRRLVTRPHYGGERAINKELAERAARDVETIGQLRSDVPSEGDASLAL